MPVLKNLTTIKKRKISILPKGLTQFSGTYPNNFQEFDENKETNYISFDLPTLTVDSNNKFTPKVENGYRKYPYYIGIADNNGSTLPAEFNPSLYNFYEMFGVHFFDKALDIVIKQAIIGCKKYPFFSNAQIYTGTDTDKKGYVCVYSYKNINKVSFPTLLSFTVLNGVEEPKVYIDDNRLNLYTDKYVFGTADTNTNTYKNIRFERRLFSPTPYKKVYNITATDIATSGIRFYYKPFRLNEFTRINVNDYNTTDKQYERVDNLTKEEFKLEKFYIKANNEYIRETKYYDNLAPNGYYVKKQLYIINSKYGEYQLEPVTCGDNTSNILCYRKGEMVLWKEPVKEHGIEVSSDYVTSDGEVIDTRSVEDTTMPYNVTDNGKYQYVAVDNDETTIYATDEYDEYTLTHYNGVKILSNGVLYFGSSKDAYNFCAKSEESYKEDPEATMYVFYYLDTPQETDYEDNYGNKHKFGNHSTYPYLTVADFRDVSGEPPVRRLSGSQIPAPGTAGRALYEEMMAECPQQKVNYILNRDTNYPYDWVEKDKYDKGWTFTGINVNSSDKKIPVLFSKKHTVLGDTTLENINLQEYPGYICKVTAKKNELRMRLKDTINSLTIYGNNFGTHSANDLVLDGFYEKDCDYTNSDKLSNLRFFTVTDFDNNRIVSPVIDARTLHVTYMNYTSDSPQNVRVLGHTFNFSVVEHFDSKWFFDMALFAQAYTKNEIYIWPQRPTIGEQYTNGAIYDILEMPYLTNYEFEFSSGFPKRRTTQNDTEGEVEMSAIDFPELGENEFWEFSKDTSMKIDLTKAVSGTEEEYQRLGYKIAYIRFRDYKTKKYTYNELVSMKTHADGDGLRCEFYPDDDDIAPGWPKYLYYESQGSSSEHKTIHWKSGSGTYPINSTSALIFNTRRLNTIKRSLSNYSNFETDEPIIFTCYARAIKVNPNNFPSPPSLEPWTNFLVRDVTNIQRYMTSSYYMAINEIEYGDFLTAVKGGYSPNNVNVWFDKNNSQGTLDYEVIGVPVGGTLTLPSYEGTKDGYVRVNGWSRSNTATTAEYSFNSIITVNEGMTLYAVFVPQQTIQYTITFSKNGSTGQLNPYSYTKNDGSTLILPTYQGTKDGYVQVDGWATSPDALSPQYSFGQQITVTDNMTLYAVFVEPEPDPEPEDNE